jgi:hypothetical protein
MNTNKQNALDAINEFVANELNGFSHHKRSCPMRYDQSDDCMCDYIKPRKKNGSRVTNRLHVKKLALSSNPKMRQVGQSFFDAVERNCADFIRRYAASQKRGVRLS